MTACMRQVLLGNLLLVLATVLAPRMVSAGPSTASRTASAAGFISASDTGSATRGEASIQSVAFNVKFSEPLAIYHFVQNVSGKAFVPDNPMKKLFMGSTFNQPKYRALLADFETLTLDYNYEYGPEKLPGSTWFLLKRSLIHSETIDQFKHRSLGVIPNASLFKLSSILTAFAPVYRELVYEPNKEVFERQLGELRDLTESTHMASYLDLGTTFYNSSWDNSVPFNLVFYPLPNSRGWMATTFYDNAESAIPTSLTDYNGLLSVVFHEIFHTLYDEQSAVFKEELVQWFISNPSRNSGYALRLLDESLATALGNGYVLEQLSGQENPRNWYDDKYINHMAKKIYPLVREYVEGRRSLDKSFVDRYVDVYDENLAVFSELNNIMASRYVLSDNPEDFDVIDRTFPGGPTTRYEPISAGSIERMLKTPITKIIVVSEDNDRKLQQIKNSVPELVTWKPDAGRDFSHSIRLKDKTYLVVVNAVRGTTEALLGTLELQ